MFGTITSHFWVGTAVVAFAVSSLGAPKPVPRMQAVPQPGSETSFQRDGVELARFHFGANLNRPFVFPVVGASGRSLTRMGHPRDPEGHSHHNSIWISHHDVNGVSFWGDQGGGRILHRRIERLEDGDESAHVLSTAVWMAGTGKVLLNERRQTSVHWLPDGEWSLVLDLQLEAASEAITLGKTPFGILGVRMAKTIGVSDGGGAIRSSEGAVNEKGVFWKAARWVDYSGPITPSASEGITLMDHPANPNHPSVFHVRDDGWMGASLTFAEPMTLTPGKPLVLRYGLYIHKGIPSTNALQGRWEKFVTQPIPNLSSPPGRPQR